MQWNSMQCFAMHVSNVWPVSQLFLHLGSSVVEVKLAPKSAHMVQNWCHSSKARPCVNSWLDSSLTDKRAKESCVGGLPGCMGQWRGAVLLVGFILCVCAAVSMHVTHFERVGIVCLPKLFDLCIDSCFVMFAFSIQREYSTRNCCVDLVASLRCACVVVSLSQQCAGELQCQTYAT